MSQKELRKKLMMAPDVPGEALTILEDSYAVRLFLNGHQEMPQELSENEALNFREAARHLASWLTKKYHLGR